MSDLTAATLSKAMGGTLTLARYGQLAGPVSDALRQANCTTVNRAAMFLAQIGHESLGLRYMEEIASGAAYEGRKDLGNTHTGDGKRFKGRGPIQITGRTNYTAVSKWAFQHGYVPTQTYFVDHPAQLAKDQYGFLGAVWYWTVARNMNAYADKRDIEGATRAVNGALNGLTDRRTRWQRCLNLAQAIVPGTPVPPPKTKTEKVTVQPTKGSIHTHFGQWGRWWSWNRKNGQGQHGGDDWHNGPKSTGNPIYAVADGKVIHQGKSRTGSLGWGPAFGNHVLITWSKKQPGENFHRTSIDAHMTKVAVTYGQQVKAGDLIGYLGATGNVTGPHDHHEQHAGQGWGDKRLKPVYPGRTITVQVDQEELDVATQQPAKVRRIEQNVKRTKNSKYQLLRIDDKSNLTFGFGGGRYELDLRLIFSGITANDELMVRVVRVDIDTKTKKQVGKTTTYPVVGLPGGAGNSYRQFRWRRHIPAPKKGISRRLRVEVANFSKKTIRITRVDANSWKASL